MNSFLRFLQFNFIPRSADFALLVLRVWLGVSMLALHGWGKVTNFGAMSSKFSDPIGVGPHMSLGLATFGEFLCAALLALGLTTRFAALVLAIVMATAFSTAHGMKLSGPGSGELAFIYLAGFVTIFIAGPGRFSVDRKLGGAA
ncbi:MAG TPA: DoxX family protein [Opitutus sp.]|nr:DoxX family protein [Opitutus sp.]